MTLVVCFGFVLCLFSFSFVCLKKTSLVYLTVGLKIQQTLLHTVIEKGVLGVISKATSRLGIRIRREIAIGSIPVQQKIIRVSKRTRGSVALIQTNRNINRIAFSPSTILCRLKKLLFTIISGKL